MKYIKKYENGYSSVDEELTKKYKDKFFISPVYMRKYDWIKEDFYIVLVKSVEIKNNPQPYKDIKGQLKPHTHCTRSDSFTVMKNGKIENPAGWGHDYTKEEFNEIDFMTAQEFYNKDPELVERLYWKVIDVIKSGKCSNWYCEMCENYESVLSKVKQLEYINAAKKYNM